MNNDSSSTQVNGSNRTIVGLKLPPLACAGGGFFCSNRTIVGLKRVSIISRLSP